MNTATNLNTYPIRYDKRAGGPRFAQIDNGTSEGPIDAVFRNLPERLCAEIANAQHVVGCVAWLTHPDVLATLARVSCSIIVQKEDFLRPDSAGHSESYLRLAYARLVCKLERPDMGWPLSAASYCVDPTMGAIRCVGNHNRTRAPAWPRMHNKFFVFGDIAERPVLEDDYGDALFVPKSVWTGSFNPTRNGERSLENAVIIRDTCVASAYYDEFAQIALLSEPLDWESDWCAPEWKIGT
jgi:hypothetical protein